MKQTRIRSSIAALAGLSLVAASCGSDTSTEPETAEPVTTETVAVGADDDAVVETTTTSEPVAVEELPTVVVTTNILGDVVGEVVGDLASVVTVMPIGADPHDFQPSAREVDSMMSADALIVNGEGFEEGLLDVIDNATDEGIPTFEAISAVDTIDFGAGGHDHGDDEHGDDEHGDDEHGDDEHGDDEHGDDE